LLVRRNRTVAGRRLLSPEAMADVIDYPTTASDLPDAGLITY
jgi:hypothetical protein